MTSPVDLSATELAAAIRDGAVTASAAVAASLDRIRRLEGRLGAFVTVADVAARRAAEAADARRRAGRPLGPLHGLPVAIKDTTDTAGIRTTNGSPFFAAHVPAEDDLVVARLKAAGAIVIGKTNLPEFGFGAICRSRVGGTTSNPYDLALTSGASSGGSAAAVAAAMVPLAHGTDFGGSVRTPASFCGVVGVRPGAGLVPAVPKPLPWDVLTQHGVLARDCRDAALMLQAISGGDPRDPATGNAAPMARPPFGDPGLAELRVATTPDLGICAIDDRVVAVFDDAVARMREAVRTVVPATPDCTGAQEAFETLRAPIVLDLLGPLFEHGPDALTETSRWNAERGRDVTAARFLAAERLRGQLIRRFTDFFDRYDVLATVAASLPPWPNATPDVLAINGRPLRHIIDYLTITYAISVVGMPSIVIPCGWTPEGLPIGMQLVGRRFDEARLLAFADRLQQRCGFTWRRPALLDAA